MGLDIDVHEFNEVLGKYGLSPLELPEVPAAKRVLLGDLRSSLELGGSWIAMGERVQAEIGQPGQRIWDGQIATDVNPNYYPCVIRGCYSNPGLYEQIYRGEPLVYDAVRTHTEALVSGTWELQAPQAPPRRVRRKLEDFVAYHNARLKSVEGGWPKAVEHMCSMIKDGFALHEVVWARDVRGAYIKKFAFRSPSTLSRWVLDSRARDLIAVELEVGGAAPEKYSLPYAGKRATDRRVLLQNMGGYGNDFEGVAPLRTALVYSKLKQLLIQIAAVTADLFGVPLRTVRRDPGWTGTPAAEADVKKAFRALSSGRSVDGPVLLMPDGVVLDTHAIGGAMPSFEWLINYCDRLMLVPFSNEGSLLGVATSGGAYALGEVKEREQLRTAPYYARLLAEPINDLLAHLCRDEIGLLDEYPKLVWRIDGAEDGSKWLADAKLLMGDRQLEDWPAPMRSAALEKLRLPPDTFKEWDAKRAKEKAAEQPEPEPEPEPEPGDKQQEVGDAA